jgi:hypothetical protein
MTKNQLKEINFTKEEIIKGVEALGYILTTPMLKDRIGVEKQERLWLLYKMLVKLTEQPIVFMIDAVYRSRLISLNTINSFFSLHSKMAQDSIINGLDIDRFEEVCKEQETTIDSLVRIFNMNETEAINISYWLGFDYSPAGMDQIKGMAANKQYARYIDFLLNGCDNSTKKPNSRNERINKYEESRNTKTIKGHYIFQAKYKSCHSETLLSAGHDGHCRNNVKESTGICRDRAVIKPYNV